MPIDGRGDLGCDVEVQYDQKDDDGLRAESESTGVQPKSSR